MRRSRPALLLIGAAFAWGASTVTSKYALRGLTAVDLLSVEIATATLALWVAALMRGAGRAGRHWPGFALLGFLEPALSYALFNAGLQRTGAADGALLVSSESLFVVLLAAAILRERLSRRGGVALLVGLAGAALVATEGGSASSSLLGDLLVLAGSLAAGGYSVAARTFADRAPALTVTAYQFLAAAIFVSPLTIAEVAESHSHLAAAPADQLIAAVATGLLGSVIAFLLFNVAIARTSASRAAIILNLIPVFGTIGAIVLLAERPTLLQLVGGMIILGGLLVLDDEESTPPKTTTRALLEGPEQWIRRPDDR